MSVELNDPTVSPNAAPALCEWISPPLGARSKEHFLLRPDDCEDAPAERRAGFVLLGGEGEARARELLESGFAGVLLGEAAVRDFSVVDRLVCRFGGDRVGVAVGAVRLEVSWALDAESNADFRVMRPSHVLPDWELLLDGRGSGVLLSWWLGRLFERGVARAVVGVDVLDDADLNILAGLVGEAFGERLAFELRASVQARFDDCVTLAGARRFVADWAQRGRLPEPLRRIFSAPSGVLAEG